MSSLVKAAVVNLPNSLGGGSVSLKTTDLKTIKDVRLAALKKLEGRRLDTPIDPDAYEIGRPVEGGSYLPVSDTLEIESLSDSVNEAGVISLQVGLSLAGARKVGIDIGDVPGMTSLVFAKGSQRCVSSAGEGLVTGDVDISRGSNWTVVNTEPEKGYISPTNRALTAEGKGGKKKSFAYLVDFNGRYLKVNEKGVVSTGTKSDKAMFRILHGKDVYLRSVYDTYLAIDEEGTVSCTKTKGDVSKLRLICGVTQGYLRKKSSRGIRGIRGWNKRYFVLTRDVLSYYDDRADFQRGDQAKFEAANYSGVVVSAADSNSDGASSRFNVEFSSGQVMELKAASPEQAEMWVKALRAKPGVRSSVQRRMSTFPGQTADKLKMMSSGNPMMRAAQGRSTSRLSSGLPGLTALPEEGQAVVDSPDDIIPDDVKLSFGSTSLEGKYLFSDGKGGARAALMNHGCEWVVTGLDLKDVVALSADGESKDNEENLASQLDSNCRFVVDYQYRYLTRGEKGMLKTDPKKSLQSVWKLVQTGEKVFLRDPFEQQYVGIADRRGGLFMDETGDPQKCSFEVVYSNISGFLTKKGNTGLRTKKVRFFQLLDDHLRYYDSYEDFVANKVIKEFAVSSISRVAVASKVPNRFNVEFKNDHPTLELTADSSKDARRWVRALSCKGIQSYAKQRLSVVQHNMDHVTRKQIQQTVVEKNKELLLKSISDEAKMVGAELSVSEDHDRVSRILVETEQEIAALPDGVDKTKARLLRKKAKMYKAKQRKLKAMLDEALGKF